MKVWSQFNQTVANRAPAPVESDPSDQEFEKFIYLISHDVRASVRALIELPQWIEEDLLEEGRELPATVTRSIRMMNTHTFRLDRMLNDLLVHSRISRMQTFRSNDLNAAIDTVLEKLAVPEGFKIERELNGHSVYMGERDVLTMLEASISNSIKHHDRESGTIRISAQVGSGELILDVSDDGPGIEPEYREKVFEAMAMLQPRDEVEGSGMGLTHIRKIAEDCGGNAEWLDVDTDRGSRLEIRLPLYS